MKIENDCVVELDYILMDDQGKVWESSTNGETWLYLQGHGQLMPGLEEALLGKGVGQKVKVELAPEEAYGPYEPELCTEVPIAAFAEVENLTEGMQLAAEGQDGVHSVTVTKITDELVTIDANHPLAGVTIKTEVKVLMVRAATEEEISHGHPHQHGACDHH